MRWNLSPALLIPCLLFPCLLFPFTRRLPSQTGTPSDPSRVLVVYNSAWPDQNGNGQGDSTELANTYRYLRRVPRDRLLGVHLSTTNRKTFPGSRNVAWDRFINELVVPIRNKLNSIGKTKIDTILLCYGVPHAVNLPGTISSPLRSIDDLLDQPFHSRLSLSTVTTNRYQTINPYFHTNPTKSADRPRFSHSLTGLAETYMVCRLDGVNLQNAKDLIASAQYNEKYGALGQGKISGTAYIDSRHGFKTDTYLRDNYPTYPGVTSIYARYSYMMSYGKTFPIQKGIPTKWEYTGFEIGETGATWASGGPALSAPNALLYFGWYNYSQFLDVWHWVPGALACDLDSNSLQNFHDPNRSRPSFLSAGLERGLTGASGVIAEPYINGHTRPEVMLYYLLKGRTFAEATAAADPRIGWRTVHIGDPLYTPFHANTRIVDKKPPYSYARSTLDTTAGTATVDAYAYSWFSNPELALFRLLTGEFPNQQSESTPYNSIYRGYRRMTFALPTSVYSQKAHYFAVETKDPAGNTWARTYLYAPKPWTQVYGSIRAEKNLVRQGAKVRLNFAYGSQNYFWSIKTQKIERWDFTAGKYVDLTATVHQGKIQPLYSTDYKIAGYSYLFPTGSIAKGSYGFFRYQVSDGTQTRFDYTFFRVN